MQNWMKAAAIMACIAALLAGCGAKTPAESQQPEEEPVQETPAEETKPDITLEQVMEANKIENLLENHNVVQIKTSLYEQEGDETPISTIKSQYTMENGYLQMYRVFSDRDGGSYYEEGRADGTYSGALYAMNSDGSDKYMTICPADEYASIVTEADRVDPPEGAEETTTDASWQDGTAVLTAKVTYRDEADTYDVVYYFADPDTCELLAVNTYSYSTADDAPMGVTQEVYTYDAAEEREASPFQAIITDKDYCELNVIVDYMGENQAVYWYPVAHDTQAYFQTNRMEYSLYGDEAMTKALDKSDAINVSGDAANLFVVYGK